MKAPPLFFYRLVTIFFMEISEYPRAWKPAKEMNPFPTWSTYGKIGRITLLLSKPFAALQLHNRLRRTCPFS